MITATCSFPTNYLIAQVLMMTNMHKVADYWNNNIKCLIMLFWALLLQKVENINWSLTCSRQPVQSSQADTWKEYRRFFESNTFTKQTRFNPNDLNGEREESFINSHAHLLTMLMSSWSFCSPAALSLSLASASRPFRIGISKRFLNSWAVPERIGRRMNTNACF